jgi:cysteine desulfurase family protein
MEVINAMSEYLVHSGANPGRGSHYSAMKASKAIFETRVLLANFFGIKNPNDIFFTQNTTQALNQAIFGFVKQGDHVICTNIEHNSVRRPLEYLKKNKKVELTYMYSDSEGNINLKKMQETIKKNTRMIIINHSSNLLGSILPICDISDLCKKHNVKLLVDAAQTAGTISIDIHKCGIDMLAFPGHKSLLGPQGTGGLYVSPDINIDPLLYGGTGSQSELVEQPQIRPDRYESGTQNVAGIVGLGKGIQLISQNSLIQIHKKQWNQTQKIIESISGLDGIKILGPRLGHQRTGIVSFAFEDIDASKFAFVLDRSYRISVRSGLHCSPLAHEVAGTLNTGAIRASVGYYTTDQEIETFIEAVKEIKNKSKGVIG